MVLNCSTSVNLSKLSLSNKVFDGVRTYKVLAIFSLISFVGFLIIGANTGLTKRTFDTKYNDNVQVKEKTEVFCISPVIKKDNSDNLNYTVFYEGFYTWFLRLRIASIISALLSVISMAIFFLVTTDNKIVLIISVIFVFIAYVNSILGVYCNMVILYDRIRTRIEEIPNNLALGIQKTIKALITSKEIEESGKSSIILQYNIVSILPVEMKLNKIRFGYLMCAFIVFSLFITPFIIFVIKINQFIQNGQSEEIVSEDKVIEDEEETDSTQEGNDDDDNEDFLNLDD